MRFYLNKPTFDKAMDKALGNRVSAVEKVDELMLERANSDILKAIKHSLIANSVHCLEEKGFLEMYRDEHMEKAEREFYPIQVHRMDTYFFTPKQLEEFLYEFSKEVAKDCEDQHTRNMFGFIPVLEGDWNEYEAWREEKRIQSISETSKG